jgi:nucleoid-associated protein YgaU
VSGPRKVRSDRTLTPAVAAAGAFATLAAALSILFVAARGGLQLPVAASATPSSEVAVASPVTPTPGPTAASTPIATTAPPSLPAPSAAPPATPAPTAAPTVGPTGPPDPLLALPGCPGHPGCFEYTVRRGDSFTAVNDRYDLLLWITQALNPEVTDESLIAVGQTLYLGRDPMARLDFCPDATCRLYVVRSGDTLSRIATRYGISVEGILALNADLAAGGHLVTGHTIRLPLFA